MSLTVLKVALRTLSMFREITVTQAAFSSRRAPRPRAVRSR
jgi:hypothetical protein